MRGGPEILATALLAATAGASAEAAAQEADWLASTGFPQRAEVALLHADRDSLRALRRRDVSGLVATVPRIELRAGIGDDRHFALHATDVWRDDPEDTFCVLTVYLNGGRIYPADGRAATVRAVDRAIDLRDVDGLEVHATETAPVGDGTCGAVLLWSRRARRDVDEPFEGQLRGRAMWLPDDAPAGGIEMTLIPGGRVQATDSGGWFDFGGLTAGIYEITATAPDGASWTDRVLVRAFAISQIAIEVTRREEADAW